MSGGTVFRGMPLLRSGGAVRRLERHDVNNPTACPVPLKYLIIR